MCLWKSDGGPFIFVEIVQSKGTDVPTDHISIPKAVAAMPKNLSCILVLWAGAVYYLKKFFLTSISF